VRIQIGTLGTLADFPGDSQVIQMIQGNHITYINMAHWQNETSSAIRDILLNLKGNGRMALK
jgi:hypothetical protein